MSGGSSSASSASTRLAAAAATIGGANEQPHQQQPAPPPQHQRQQPQCLDYFGDTDANKPAQLCAAPKAAIVERLRELRLRHCCERTALSALHNEALADVRAGGADCERRLHDLMDADTLAERVTCELNDILVRYDCRQLYSIKHGCLDCKVSDL